MIVSKNGLTMMEGKHSEVIADILSIIEGVNKALENGDMDSEDLYTMVSIAPETITKFCNNCIDSIHK